MLINLEQAEIRETSENNLMNKLMREKTREGVKNLDSDQKVSLAVDSNVTSISEAAKNHNVSRATAQKYSQLKGMSEEEKSLVEQKLSTTRSVAIDKLMLTLGLISLDDLRNQDARQLSVIAANLSKVASNMNPVERTHSAVQVVVYGPRQKEVDEYKIIEVTR